MTPGQFRVHEIRELKRATASHEARKLLEEIARTVQPVMEKRGWSVGRLEEFCPKSEGLLGLNVNRGQVIKIRLRSHPNDKSFFPLDQSCPNSLLGTMCHELCHNEIGAHSKEFYALLDKVQDELDGFLSKGVRGGVAGVVPFQGDGVRLGGRNQSEGQAGALAARAAENRLRKQAMGGSHVLGGDSKSANALSPREAAARAAERRLRDQNVCGCSGQVELEEWTIPEKGAKGDSSKVRNTTTLPAHPRASAPKVSAPSPTKKRAYAPDPSAVYEQERMVRPKSGLVSAHTSTQVVEPAPAQETHAEMAGQKWKCHTCTLLNEALWLVCDACLQPRYPV